MTTPAFDGDGRAPRAAGEPALSANPSRAAVDRLLETSFPDTGTRDRDK